MPLQTSITRGGELVPLPWGDFHVASLALAAMFDVESPDFPVRKPEEIYTTDELSFECYPDAAFPVTKLLAFMLSDYGALSKTPLNGGAYTLRGKHRFMDAVTGAVLTLLPGDVLRAWR